MAYPMPPFAQCVNCGRKEHALTQCPEPVRTLPDAALPIIPHPTYIHPVSQQGIVPLKQESFLYPGAPRIPAFGSYPSADILVEDLFKWGQAMGAWALGFQSYAIQLSEVVKMNGGPFFKVDDGGVSVTIQLPDTDKAQRELGDALERASDIINQTIPSIPGFAPSGFVALSPEINHGFPRYSESTAQQAAGLVGSSPTPVSKNRGKGNEARDRGGSTRGGITKQRSIFTPKKAATTTKRLPAAPKRRTPAKKKAAKESVTDEDQNAEDRLGESEGLGGSSITGSLTNATTETSTCSFTIYEKVGRDHAKAGGQVISTDQRKVVEGITESAVEG